MEEDKRNFEERMKVSESKVGLLNEVKRKLMDYTKSLEDKLCSTDKQCCQSMEANVNTAKKVAELETQNVELKSKIDLLNEQIKILIVEKTATEKCLKENETGRFDLCQKIVQLETELKDSSDKFVEIMIKNKQLCDENEKQSKIIEANKESLNNQIVSLENEKSATDIMNKELVENLMEKESNCISSNFKCDELKETNSSLQCDIEKLNEQVIVLLEEKDNLCTRIEKLETNITELTKTNSQLVDRSNETIAVTTDKTFESVTVPVVASKTSEVLEGTPKSCEMCNKYEEDQKNILEMQNMMVSDMEKMVLNLESDKKQLEDKITTLNKEKQLLIDGNSKLNEFVNKKLHEADGSSFSITETLLSQIKDLQKKLSSAHEDLVRKDMEYHEKIASMKGGNNVQLENLRADMKEEIDILESRKDEETEELCENFTHLEVEFTLKLAEMKEYYETLLTDEKAEFGRVLVMKVDDYEKKVAEKTDEILGWETKLISMQLELDNKMIVIEELEERLNEFDVKASPKAFRNIKFTPILPTDLPNNHHFDPEQRKRNLQSSRSLDMALSGVDIPSSNLDNKTVIHKPILSLVIPSTYSDGDVTPIYSCGNENSLNITSQTNTLVESLPSCSVAAITSPSSAFTRVGKTSSITPVRSTLFVSRDFPTDAALHSSSNSQDADTTVTGDQSTTSNVNPNSIDADQHNSPSNAADADHTFASSVDKPSNPANTVANELVGGSTDSKSDCATSFQNVTSLPVSLNGVMPSTTESVDSLAAASPVATSDSIDAPQCSQPSTSNNSTSSA